MYVVDYGNSRVQKFSADGAFIRRWGSFGSGKGQFRNPQGIATDAAGNVYVGDSGNDRVQVLRDSGPPYRNAVRRKPAPTRSAPAPEPPRIAKDFSARGRYLAPDRGA